MRRLVSHVVTARPVVAWTSWHTLNRGIRVVGYAGPLPHADATLDVVSS
jgi:hypothetical protein